MPRRAGGSSAPRTNRRTSGHATPASTAAPTAHAAAVSSASGASVSTTAEPQPPATEYRGSVRRQPALSRGIVGVPHWTFARPGECLTISRQRTAEGLLLVVTDSGLPRSYFFNHIAPLTTFQAEMEAALIRNGWSFIAVEPERRSGSPRRRLR